MSDEPNNITKLLTALVTPHQPLEDAWQQLRLLRSVDTAVGVQLDMIGEIVGQERGGMVDDDYRRFVRARIAANISDGRVFDLIKVATLVVNDDDTTIQLDLQGNAAVVVRILNNQ